MGKEEMASTMPAWDLAFQDVSFDAVTDMIKVNFDPLIQFRHAHVSLWAMQITDAAN